MSNSLVSVIIRRTTAAKYILLRCSRVEADVSAVEVMLSTTDPKQYEDILKPWWTASVYQESQRGPASARNAGIRAAKDNYRFSRRDMLAAVQASAADVAVFRFRRRLVYADTSIIDGAGKSWNGRRIFETWGAHIQKLFERNFISDVNGVIRKACIDLADISMKTRADFRRRLWFLAKDRVSFQSAYLRRSWRCTPAFEQYQRIWSALITWKENCGKNSLGLAINFPAFAKWANSVWIFIFWTRREYWIFGFSQS